MAADVDLPTTSRCGRWPADGRTSPPVPGEPEELGRLLEASFDPAERQRRGAHFTPAPLADELVERALAGHERPSVGDPACGGGALLLAAARHLAAARRGPGRDRRPAVGRRHRSAGRRHDRGRARRCGRGTAPAARPAHRRRRAARRPGLAARSTSSSATRRSSRRSAARRARTAARRRAAARAVRRRPCAPYTDAAGLFLLGRASSPRPGGTVAHGAAAVGAGGPRRRRRARRRRRTRAAWSTSSCRPAPGFDAAVEVCVPVIEVGGRGRPAARWSAHLARRPRRARRRPARRRRRSGDEATTTAAFRNEYYGMVDHVARAATTAPPGRPLVTTGLDRPRRAAPGASGPRGSAAAPGSRPVVDVGALEGRAADWARRTGGPKLFVATQTQGRRGRRRRGGRVDRRRAAGGGAGARRAPLAAGRRAGRPGRERMAARSARRAPRARPRSLKVTAALLREVPLPTDRRRLGARHGGVPGAATSRGSPTAMSDAYGTGPDVAAWWSRASENGLESVGERAGRISPTSGVARATGSSNLGRTPKVLSHPSGWGCGPGDRATKCSGLDPPRVSAPARRRRTGGRSAVG